MTERGAGCGPVAEPLQPMHTDDFAAAACRLLLCCLLIGQAATLGAAAPATTDVTTTARSTEHTTVGDVTVTAVFGERRDAAVDLRLRVAVAAPADNVTLRLDPAVELTDAGGLERVGEHRYRVFAAGETVVRGVYRLDAARGGPLAREPGGWALVDHPVTAVTTEVDRAVRRQTRLADDRPGHAGERLAALGAVERTRRTLGERPVTFVRPTAATLSNESRRGVVADLRAAAARLGPAAPPDEPDGRRSVFWVASDTPVASDDGVPDGTPPGEADAATVTARGDGVFPVARGAPSDFVVTAPSGEGAVDTGHLAAYAWARTTVTPGGRMAWFRSAVASYARLRLETVADGGVRRRYAAPPPSYDLRVVRRFDARERLLAAAGPVRGADLLATDEPRVAGRGKGAVVLAALDGRIRAATDGDATLWDVLARLRGQGRIVTFDSLARAATTVSGRDQRAWLTDRLRRDGLATVPATVFPRDTDDDGLSDARERALGTDPADPETDRDFLDDGAEVSLGADPLAPDTDDDGLFDYIEVTNGGDPTAADTDGDGVGDDREFERGLNLSNPDTDGDGFRDDVEAAGDPGTADATATPDGDPDGDGLTTRRERSAGTNPLAADTDGDGADDAAELAAGTDPTDPSDRPATATATTTETQSFGTLVVAGVGTAAVRDTVRDGLELLAETLASALIAARTRQTLVADELVEAEIALENRLARLSAATDARCVLRETEPADGGLFEHTVAVTGADAETVAAFFDRTETVYTRPPTVTADTADTDADGADCVVRAFASDALPELLGEAGCDVRSVVAENGACRVTAGLPRERDLGRLLSTLSDRYDGVRLVAKRQPGTAGTAAAAETAAPSLTDRQREVLCAAQAMGYYEWPRERTAEAVAGELGIAGSTLHQHLRTAERRLVGAFCGTVTDAADDDAA